MAVKEKKIARAAALDDLPEGWRVVRFDEMAHLINDRVDDPSEAGVERYVGLEHLDPESLKIRRWGSPDDVEAQKLRFQPGDIIFGKRRAYQRKLAVADFEGICSAHAMVLRAREETVVKDFLPFFMQSNTFFERALSISVGSLSPTINWKTLASQQFAIPSKNEQRRIGEILWAADEMVLSWEATQSEVDKLLAAIRKEIVCNASHPRRRLEDCLMHITPGKSVVGVNQPASISEFGVLKISAVGAHGFDVEENKRLINPNDYRVEFRVKAGDFLITRCNTRELVGRVCIVPKDAPNLMLSDKTIRLDIDESMATKTFLLEALRSNEARSQIEAVATGTGGAMKNISQNEGEGDGGFCAIKTNPDVQYATSQRMTIYRTGDNWASSDDITPNYGAPPRNWFGPITLDPSNSSLLYVGTLYPHRRDDSATTDKWKMRLGNQQLAGDADNYTTFIAVAPGDSSRIYTGASDGQVWMSKDKGEHWQRINTGIGAGAVSLPNRWVTSIAVHPTNPDVILVGLSGTGSSHLWRCDDTSSTARTWKNVSGPMAATSLPDIPLNTVVIDPRDPAQVYYVGTDIGVFFSRDGGANWANATTSLGLPNVQVNVLKWVPDTGFLMAATFGRGIWRIRMPVRDEHFQLTIR